MSGDKRIPDITVTEWLIHHFNHNTLPFTSDDADVSYQLVDPPVTAPPGHRGILLKCKCGQEYKIFARLVRREGSAEALADPRS
jgi:hypothetical protein